jgi:hypothetical protein
MGKIKPPFVFLGPSVSKMEALAVLPQAEYCSPAERGDLYRARFLGASILVLIDGVFLQSYAPSPRELVEVVRDGAKVLGAGSLGALRAAECWPVGMHGAGLIYRLFRAGRLHSDEEVALTYDEAHRPLSVPLINVRYATHRAVKAGLIDRSEREQIVHAAASIFYAERTWPGIFSVASLKVNAERQRFLEAIDLKKRDALQALALVARWLEQDPHLAARHVRHSEAPFAFSEHVREPAADPMAGVSQVQARNELARWLLTSGRFRRYIPVKDVAADFESFAERLWVVLTRNGERDAELFRWHAVRLMSEEGESTNSIKFHTAEVQILREHGMQTWQELETWVESCGWPREWFRETRERAACARHRSEELFTARCRPGGEA